MRVVVCLLAICTLTVSSEAAERTVCATGCHYTQLQTAINEATAGDTILLRAGHTYVGNFILRAKSGTAFITIRSDAPATSLPPAGVRLVPEGKPGANTSRGALARLVGQGGTYKSVPVVRTEPGAHHYRLQFLDIDGTASLGYETIVALGANDNSQTTVDAAPLSLVLDRVWIHGHPTKGAKRGVALNSRATDILDSYIDDIFSLPDSQGIAGFNGPGPFRIINNYIEAGAENILFGGADPRIVNLVPSDIEIRGNHLYKKLAWRNPVLATPARPAASATSGGVLPAGTHYFKVVAVLVAGADVVRSAPSAEVAVAVGTNGAVQLSWSGVTGAERYRVYRGASSDGQSVYLETTAQALTYSGANERSGPPPASGRKWTVKNLLEFKSGQRVVIDGNLLENNWTGFQDGAAVLFTPRNQGGTALNTTVRQVMFSNNIVRQVGGGVSMHGYDVNAPTQQTRDIRLVNNVFDRVGGTFGQGRLLVMTSEPANITVDHNTVIGNGPLTVVSGAPVIGFVWRNNFATHNQYGIYGQGKASGLDTLNFYFPGHVVTRNVFAGGKASAYPAENHFPASAEFEASLMDPSGGNFALVASSPYNNLATDGSDIGVNMDSLARAFAAYRTSSSPLPVAEPVSPPDSPTASLPDGWHATDVGAVAVAGETTEASGVFTISASGADVWGTSDEFHFAYRALEGDGTIVARVAAVTGPDDWLKAGVMIRAGLDAGSAHAFTLVSRGKGTAFQRRRTSGALSLHTSGAPVGAPHWVRLTRMGNTVVAYTSADGLAWREVGRDSIALPATVFVGLAVTGHGALATATFDRVQLTPGTVLPTGWGADDVGVVGKGGAAAHAAGTFTVAGAGADIWGTSDALHFVHRTLPGDGEIVARITSVDGTEDWTKVGVMIRQSLDAGSAQAMMLVSKGRGLAFQRRTVTGATSTHTSGGTGSTPRWVRLARSGQTIMAAVSLDGITWKVVGSDVFSVEGAVEVGLAVSSHDVTRLATGSFDNVRITSR